MLALRDIGSSIRGTARRYDLRHDDYYVDERNELYRIHRGC